MKRKMLPKKKKNTKTQTTQIRAIVLSSDLDFRIKQIQFYCSFWIPLSSFLEKFLFVVRVSGEGNKTKPNLRPQGFATLGRRGSSAITKGLSDLDQQHGSANYQLTFTDFLILRAPTWCSQPDQPCKLTREEVTSHPALSWGWTALSGPAEPSGLRGILSFSVKAGLPRVSPLINPPEVLLGTSETWNQLEPQGAFRSPSPVVWILLRNFVKMWLPPWASCSCNLNPECIKIKVLWLILISKRNGKSAFTEEASETRRT